MYSVRSDLIIISDTVKVRMQLSRRARTAGTPKRGFIATGAEIVRKETPLGLYKGLGAVVTGIVPKMAIRFTSFEAYKKFLADDAGHVNGRGLFLGWLPLCVSFKYAITRITHQTEYLSTVE